MKFLGIGPFEFLIISVILILVVGPNELTNNARKIAQFIRKTKNSELWQTIVGSRKSFSQFTENIIPDLGLQDINQEINQLNEMRDKNLKSLENLIKPSDEDKS